MNSALSTTNNTVNDIKKALGGLTGAFTAAFGVAGIAGIVHKVIEASSEAQDALAQVEQSIKSTGGAAGVTAKQVGDLADETKKLTGIDDDLIMKMQSVLLTFTSVGKEVFPDATRAIVDMSAKLGTDLKQSAIQVGKALQDPVKGVQALHRVGVNFSESQVAMIKALQESGRQVDAQKLILRELQTEFGGAGAAARDKLGGALMALQTNIDDLMETLGMGDNGGLRGALELANISLEHLNAATADFIEWTQSAEAASSDFGKAIRAVGDGFIALEPTIKLALNTMVDWAVQSFKAMQAGLQAMLADYKFVFDWIENRFLNGPLAKALTNNPVTQAFTKTFSEELPKSIEKSNQRMSKAGTDYVGSFFKPISDGFSNLQKEVDDRMKAIHAAAARAKTSLPGNLPTTLSKDEEKARKAAQKELEKEENILKRIVAEYEKHNRELERKAKGTKELSELEEAILKIQQQHKVPLAEQQAAITRLNALQKERVELERQISVNDERKKLQDILEDMRRQNQEMLAKNQKQQELVPLLEAEKKIRDIVKVGAQENLDLQRQIREEAEKQAQIIAQQKHDEALKSAQEITKEFQEQNRLLELKLQGEEDLAPYLEAREKIEKSILSAQEKGDLIQKLNEQRQAQERLNQALEDQQLTLRAIKNSGASYAQQARELQSALQSGQINVKQYSASMNDLIDAQRKSKTAAGDFAKTITKGLEDAIFSGKSLTDVLKNMGKQLAVLAAQKLLLEPLERALTNIGNRMFGLGPNAGWLQNQGQQLAQQPQTQGQLIANANTGGGPGGILSSIGKALGIPGFKRGGYFGGGFMMTGEEGPELVYSADPARVQPMKPGNADFKGIYDQLALKDRDYWQMAKTQGLPGADFNLGAAENTLRYWQQLNQTQANNISYASQGWQPLLDKMKLYEDNPFLGPVNTDANTMAYMQKWAKGGTGWLPTGDLTGRSTLTAWTDMFNIGGNWGYMGSEAAAGASMHHAMPAGSGSPWTDAEYGRGSGSPFKNNSLLETGGDGITSWNAKGHIDQVGTPYPTRIDGYKTPWDQGQYDGAQIGSTNVPGGKVYGNYNPLAGETGTDTYLRQNPEYNPEQMRWNAPGHELPWPTKIDNPYKVYSGGDLDVMMPLAGGHGKYETQGGGGSNVQSAYDPFRAELYNTPSGYTGQTDRSGFAQGAMDAYAFQYPGASYSALGSLFNGLQGFADGGNVTGTKPVVVGERGKPEIFMPNTAGRILPAGDSGAPAQIRIINQTTGRVDGYQQRHIGGVDYVTITENTVANLSRGRGGRTAFNNLAASAIKR